MQIEKNIVLLGCCSNFFSVKDGYSAIDGQKSRQELIPLNQRITPLINLSIGLQHLYKRYTYSQTFTNFVFLCRAQTDANVRLMLGGWAKSSFIDLKGGKF